MINKRSLIVTVFILARNNILCYNGHLFVNMAFLYLSSFYQALLIKWGAEVNEYGKISNFY